MTDFIILGTDTDAGKTTFALLWLARFVEQYAYWKPVETGPSDAGRIAELTPAAFVHPPLARFKTPVAPPLAARLEGAHVPAANEIVARIPRALNGERGLVIETFGGPFSPLNETELQLALIRALGVPCVLVSSTALGAMGRTLQCESALRSENVHPVAVVLLGEPDPFAEEQISKHAAIPVCALTPPKEWTPAGIALAAANQAATLDQLRGVLQPLSTQYSVHSTQSVWHPYTPLLGADDPLMCVGTQDEFLELADGRRVIDAISSWWTILHGHRHPPLMEALAEASRRIDHVLFAGVTHPWGVELAGLLLGTMPWVGGRVFYSDNGSTAVEVALKMAYQFWRHRGQTRPRFVGFENGYHGDTFGAMAVSRDPIFFGPFEPLLFAADILPLEPDRLDQHLKNHAHETAAVILEPLVQGAGGMRMHTPDTLRQVMEIAHRHGVLFIADEVMTGGRTGTLWAHQSAGVVPDLVCAAKTLAGGVLPLAATLAGPKIVDAFLSADRSRTFFHGHSFTANPLACAVAVRSLRQRIAQPPDAPERMERFWMQAFQPLRNHPRVKEVRIRGSIAAIEIDAAGGYLADIGAAMRRACLERDVFLRPLGSVLYALPPYCTSPASLQQLAAAMIHAVESVEVRQKT